MNNKKYTVMIGYHDSNERNCYIYGVVSIAHFVPNKNGVLCHCINTDKGIGYYLPINKYAIYSIE